MKIASNILKRRYLSRSLIYFLTWCMVMNTTLPLALGLEAIDVTGSAGVIGTTWGDHTIINTDHGAIIDWNNFNTSSTQSVEFNQYLGGDLSSVSAVLNRVNSGVVPTQFNGALSANGRVFVVNPAGVVFGADSVVNVSQLVASGLNMSDDAFDAVLADSSNRMVFEGGQGEVQNLGSISADSVYLIGNKVTNLGSINAPGGLVVMAAGDNVYLGQDGSNVVVELDVESLGPGADVRNEGLVSADNGTVVLAAGDSFSGAVSNLGVLAASAGDVVIHAARVENSGVITADAAAGDGGNINITAAEEIALQPGSRTTANAGLNGSGGNVILKSEGTTVVSEGATVEARGGGESGDGGFVEVSGEHFILAGDVDTSAENGEPGTLFIDPLDVTIAAGANAGAVDTVYEYDIERDSQAGTNVIVEAENSITVEDIPDGEITGGAGDITLRTTNLDSSIIFLNREDTITTTVGDIVIEAGGGGISIGSLITGVGLTGQRVRPGRITVSTVNDGDIVTRDLFIRPGAGRVEINLDSSGNLVIEGDISVGTPTDAILNIPGETQTAAIIHLSADENIMIGGDVVGAYADSTETSSSSALTWAYIKIFAGADETANGDVTIRADLTARSRSAHTSTSRTWVEVGAPGNLYFGPDAAPPVADGGYAYVAYEEGVTHGRDTDESGRHLAKVIMNASWIGPEPKPEPEPNPDPDPEPFILVRGVAPLQVEECETAGCPALIEWAAAELGVGAEEMQIGIANSVASGRGIQPCDTCAKLQGAATVLQDNSGLRVAALVQVINEMAPSGAPPSEEENASITAAIANNNDPGNHYAMAGEYLDSLAAYVGALNSEMNFSMADSMTFAVDRYIAPLVERDVGNVGVATFLAARLTALSAS